MSIERVIRAILDLNLALKDLGAKPPACIIFDHESIRRLRYHAGELEGFQVKRDLKSDRDEICGVPILPAERRVE